MKITLKIFTAILLIIITSLSNLIVPVVQANQLVTDSQAQPPVRQEQPVLPRDTPRLLPASAKTTLSEKLYATASILGLSTYDSKTGSASKRLPLTVQKLDKHDYKADEDIAVTINNPDDEQFNTQVTDSEGKEAEVKLQQTIEGNTTAIQITPTNQFKPGKYTIAIIDQEGKTTKQDFTWGVLALNPDKATYKPKERATIGMAVLNEKGDMVCDAEVELQIKNTELGINDVLSTQNGKIVVSDTCPKKEFTLEPDYKAEYQIGGAGLYDLELTAKTGNGTFTITDNFAVEADVPFDIRRTSATRIYPPLTYPMNLEITAKEDFKGTITETVPESFEIKPTDTDTTYDAMNTLYVDDEKDPTFALEKSLLDESTTKLQMPFDGSFAISQGFGDELTDDKLQAFYSHYGLSGHDGIDFALPIGTPLYAVDDGTVVWSGPGDYGNQVVIQHSWGKSYYGHMSKTKVDKDFLVKKSSQIGYSGNTGGSTGPHLHFGMKPSNPDIKNGYTGKVDPLPYLPAQVKTNVAKQSLSFANQSTVLSATSSAESSLAPQEATETPASASAAPSASSSAETLFTVADEQINREVAQDQAAAVEKVKVIKWEVSLKKGEKTTLSYKFKTPKISPQFYLLGPLQFFSSDQETPVFEENRQWQIAADVVGSIKFMESGTDATQDFYLYDQAYPTTGTQIPVSSTTQEHTGPRSMRFNSGNPADISIVRHNNVLADTGTRISFYMYIPTTFTNAAGLIQMYQSDNATYVGTILELFSTGKLKLGEGSTYGKTTIQSGRWYHISVAYTLTSATVNESRLYVNGILDASASNLTFFNTGTNVIRLGIITVNVGDTDKLIYYDDLYIDDGNDLTDPGPVRVSNKRPNANGTSNSFPTSAGAGSGYGSGHSPQVNEQPQNVGGNWTSSGASQSENYDIESSSTGDTDISGGRLLGYQAWVIAKSTGTCTTPQITNNGTNTNITLTAFDGAYFNYVLSSRYPSSAAKVGLVSCSSGGGTATIDEAGMHFAYLGPTLPEAMRHGKGMDTGTGVELPFSF